MKNKKNFVVFTKARSGSTLLVNYLNNFDNVVCHGEVFKRSMVGRVIADDPYFKNLTMEMRDESPIKTMNALFNITKDKHTGFKIFPLHNKKVQKRSLRSENIYKIHLTRNEIDSFLSLKIAIGTGIWVSKRRVKKGKKFNLVFDEDDFSQYLKNSLEFDEFVQARATGPILNISYDQIVNDDGMKQIANFLEENYNQNVYQTKLKKQRPKSYEDIVENYQQMEDYLRINHFSLFNKSILF